MGIVIGN